MKRKKKRTHKVSSRIERSDKRTELLMIVVIVLITLVGLFVAFLMSSELSF